MSGVKGRGAGAVLRRLAQSASGISARTRSADRNRGIAGADSDESSRVAHDDIARRAYDIYLARGATPGHDLDDWIQAERELCFPAAQP